MANIKIAKKVPSVGWGAIIICGTTVGAGMFTLPTMLAGAWYVWSIVILAVCWLGMLISGLMLQKTTQYYPSNFGYDAITRDLLGNTWAEINGLSIFFVLGILTYAYISAIGPIYKSSLNSIGFLLSNSETKVLVTFIIALIVWLGTDQVGKVMSFILITKTFLLLLLFGGLIKTVNMDYLFDTQSINSSYWPYTLGIIPFCIASFGYHGNIIELNKYYSSDHKKIQKCLFIGTSMALIIYIFWLTCSMGNLPRSIFPNILKHGGDIHLLMENFKEHIKIQNFSILFSVFSHFAVLCSFLGVASGLLDYISDRFKLSSTKVGRLQATCITFFLPLTLSIFYPNGFLKAIGYAGLLATIWAIIVPALLYSKAKNRFQPKKRKTKVSTHKFLIIFAGINISAWFLSVFHILPIFGENFS